MMNFNNSRQTFYSRLYYDSENGPFEVPPGFTKTHDKKRVLDAPKLYVLQKKKYDCVLCSLSSAF